MDNDLLKKMSQQNVGIYKNIQCFICGMIHIHILNLPYPYFINAYFIT